MYCLNAFPYYGTESFNLDVYNVQLSNDVAEKLAKVCVESGNGAFASCGFVSGGNYSIFIEYTKFILPFIRV